MEFGVGVARSGAEETLVGGECGAAAGAPVEPVPLPPGRDELLVYLAHIGVPPDLGERLVERADRNGTDLLTELAAEGVISEERQYRALADLLRLPYLAELDPENLVLSEAQSLTLLGTPDGGQIARLSERRLTARVIAPRRMDVRWTADFIDTHPEVRYHLRMTSPRVLRQALVRKASATLLRRACAHLFEAYPDLSARFVGKAWQGALFAVIGVALAAGLLLATMATVAVIHAVASIFFLACVVLRLTAAWKAEPLRPVDVEPPASAEAPVYSVLVALYREAEIVPQLLAALSRLHWPRSRLEIKIICEADDAETLAALDAQELRPWVEVIRVPPGLPRTKPKALAYALPLTSGAYVVLYDAEDRPHPMQLAEAWRRFQESPPDVTCLQAPLSITNAGESRIAHCFAIEYAALFRGLLPFLARKRWLLPLGGTSNHFRREVLEALGGWDPYNVTEDADFAVRLARFGYRSETLVAPTGEDATAEWRTWVPQRTRWFKGFAATWLVHMREPARSFREMGGASFATMQILLPGAILSTLVHPLFLVMIGWALVDLAMGKGVATFHSAILLVDAANISLGYLSFWMLAWKTLRPVEKRGFWKVMLFTPVYWTMMAVAAWRAVTQLLVRPHQWEKTPHRPRRAQT